MGIFDPPIPVTACTGDASACLYGPTKISSAPASTTELMESVTALADQITTTSALPAPTISAGPSSTGNAEFASLLASAKLSLASLSSTANLPKSTSRAGPANYFFSAQTAPDVVASFELSVESSLGTIDLPDPQAAITSINLEINSQSKSLSPPSPTVIAIVASNTFAALPGSSGIILPNGSIASFGEVVTIPNASNSPMIVSVDSSNILVGSETYSIPDITPISSSPAQGSTAVVIATLSGNTVISVAPGASSIIIGTQTVYIDGPTVTEGANVVRLTPSGVEIGNTNNPITSTYHIPTVPLIPQNSVSVNVGVVGVHSISVKAISLKGLSAAVVGGQTISIGGPAAILTGSNIASLGASGVIIQAPAQIITTIPVPSAQKDPANMAIVNGQTISVVAGSSSLSIPIAIVAQQTISAGGAAATLSGGQIASLGTSGVVIQASGGYSTTVLVPSSTTPVNSASFVPAGVDGGQTISVEFIQGSSGAIVAGQTLSYGGPIATLSGENVVTFGVNGVVVQAPGGKVTTIPITTTYFASVSDKVIKTFEFGAPTTGPPVLDASSSRTGSATLVQSDNSAQRIDTVIWLSPLLFGWVGILIMT